MKILVAGIGNIFFGDDAFGVEVVKALAQRPLPSGVRAIDFGIRGLDLAYALTDGIDAAILVDAMPRGSEPGTVFLLEPDVADGALPGPSMDAHALDPWRVLALAKTLGGALPRVVLVGCEPATLEGLELSAPVRAAVPEAAQMIESALARFASGNLTTERKLP